MYIDREALRKQMQIVCDDTTCPLHIAAEIEQSIDCAPAASVAPVVHGEWEVYLGGKELMCSACKATFWDEDGVGGSNYCPNCGAKMKGE